MLKLVNELFVRKTDNILLQLFRYGFVGVIAFLVDYGSLYAFTEFLGIHHLVSSALSFVLGLVVNYVLSTIWVFAQHSQTNKVKEFVVFTVIGVIGLGLNELIMYIGTDVLGLFYMLSKLISTALVFIWNFMARRTILFRG